MLFMHLQANLDLINKPRITCHLLDRLSATLLLFTELLKGHISASSGIPARRNCAVIGDCISSLIRRIMQSALVHYEKITFLSHPRIFSVCIPVFLYCRAIAICNFCIKKETCFTHFLLLSEHMVVGHADSCHLLPEVPSRVFFPGWKYFYLEKNCTGDINAHWRLYEPGY